MTDARGGSGGPAVNPNLKAMHSDLIALVRRLEESIDSAPTAAAINAITDQMAEVNARVTAAGKMLLARQTDEIAKYTATVSAAIPAIETDIEDIERLESVVGSLTAMLATVDEAVRVATLVCD